MDKSKKEDYYTDLVVTVVMVSGILGLLIAMTIEMWK